MPETLYRRALPPETIAFSSAAGRQVFAEALASGGLDGYFPLAEQFHTQSEPAFCGLGSLVVALNALAIDPNRLWKGPWRWFSEELLDCCVSFDEIRRRGLVLDELTCLARCNGAAVELHRADREELASWRAALAGAARGEFVVIAAYDRGAVDQVGTGHFSPIGGYHAARDLVLVLDVARFKYPPHWIAAERLWHAMEAVDPATGRSRGWMTLRPASGGALGVSLSCEGGDLHTLVAALANVVAELPTAADLATLTSAIAPLTTHLVIREPVLGSALAAAREALHALTSFPVIVDAVGTAHADAVAVLLLAIADRIDTPTRHRPELHAMVAEAAHHGALTEVVRSLHIQLEALWTFAASPSVASSERSAAGAR